jgi:subtilase family serine protease
MGVRPFFGIVAASLLCGAPGDARATADVVLAGSRHPLARPELDRGAADRATVLRGMSIVLGPSPVQQNELDALLAAQRDPSSPEYHRWLTPTQYAERFAPAEAVVDEVGAWLAASGLRVDARTRTRVSFSGTVEQVATTFRTEMRRYERSGHLRVANATDVSIPARLAPVVRAVRNLNEFRPRSRALRIRQVVPDYTLSNSGLHFLAPADFATIYGLQPLYAAGIDGAGQTIAVVGQTAIDTADVAAFRSAAALPSASPELVLVPGSGRSVVSTNDLDEASLDVEWSGGVAPRAKIVYVYTGSSGNYSVVDALQYAIEQNVAPIVSISYGACEQDWPSADVVAIRQWMQQANAQGQTVVAAAGDSGAAACDAVTEPSATRGLAVDLPASLPEVTGVGGTTLSGDASSPGTYWMSTDGTGGESATSYIPESAWNDSALEGSLASGGGGASVLFAKPAWQVGASVPGDGQRDVPDVALAASAYHDGYLICVQGSCAKGFRSSKGALEFVGGTSAGAPSFAGVLALVSQARGVAGIGNANPVLYELAATAPAAFHPIAAGDNEVPCTSGTTDCPSTAPYQIGFATSGAYSLATGLGSIDASNLAAAWPAGTDSPAAASRPDTSSPSGTAAPSGTSNGSSSAGSGSGSSQSAAPAASNPSGGGGCSQGSAGLSDAWLLTLALWRWLAAARLKPVCRGSSRTGEHPCRTPARA